MGGSNECLKVYEVAGNARQLNFTKAAALGRCLRLVIVHFPCDYYKRLGSSAMAGSRITQWHFSQNRLQYIS